MNHIAITSGKMNKPTGKFDTYASLNGSRFATQRDDGFFYKNDGTNTGIDNFRALSNSFSINKTDFALATVSICAAAASAEATLPTAIFLGATGITADALSSNGVTGNTVIGLSHPVMGGL